MTSPLPAVRVWSSAMDIALIAQLTGWASTPAAATGLPDNPTTASPAAAALNPSAQSFADQYSVGMDVLAQIQSGVIQ